MSIPVDYIPNFGNFTKEENREAWIGVWNHILSINWEEELKEYGCKISGKIEANLDDFMRIMESKYPYRNEIFKSMFDGIDNDEFMTFIEKTYTNLKCYTVTTTTDFIRIK